jgi:hypothetical protein
VTAAAVVAVGVQREAGVVAGVVATMVAFSDLSRGVLVDVVTMV